MQLISITMFDLVLPRALTSIFRATNFRCSMIDIVLDRQVAEFHVFAVPERRFQQLVQFVPISVEYLRYQYLQGVFVHVRYLIHFHPRDRYGYRRVSPQCTIHFFKKHETL